MRHGVWSSPRYMGTRAASSGGALPISAMGRTREQKEFGIWGLG